MIESFLDSIAVLQSDIVGLSRRLIFKVRLATCRRWTPDGVGDESKALYLSAFFRGALLHTSRETAFLDFRMGNNSLDLC